MARRILFLHDPREDDPYEEVFRKEGYEASSLSVLHFEFVNREALADRLARPERYAGLLVTSPRAAEALAAAPEEAWAAFTERPAFAVGPRTADELRALGFAPEGEEAGSGEELAGVIVGRTFAAPLLFLTGDRRRDVLPERLGAAGVPFEELCVYRTHLRVDHAALEAAAADWLVFFSPSGVEALRASGFDAGTARRAAIGPTTAEALEAEGWPADAVAAEPTPEGVLAAVLHAGGR